MGAGDGFFHSGPNGESPRDIAPSRLRRKILLRRRRPYPHEHTWFYTDAAQSRGRKRKESRLIISASEKPSAMERRRRQNSAPRQKSGSGPHEPPREQRRQVRAIGVLEGDNKAVTGVVVNDSGARAVKIGGICDAASALRSLPNVVRERRAAAAAHRIVDKSELRPRGRR